MGTPVVAFVPILTVDRHVHIVFGRFSGRVPGTADVASLVIGSDAAQHEAGAVVVRVGRDRAARTLPLDLGMSQRRR